VLGLRCSPAHLVAKYYLICNLVSIREKKQKVLTQNVTEHFLYRTSSVLPDGCVKQNF
jgi:hypothetical protein